MKTETLAQVFSCEFCEIFKNTLFTERLWATTFTSVFCYSMHYQLTAYFMTALPTIYFPNPAHTLVLQFLSHIAP